MRGKHSSCFFRQTVFQDNQRAYEGKFFCTEGFQLLKAKGAMESNTGHVTSPNEIMHLGNNQQRRPKHEVKGWTAAPQGGPG